MERFWSKVEKTPTCWIWKAYISKQMGYGRFHFNGRPDMAHRVAYTLVIGPIPADKVIDHVCRNRSCVRPNHMRLVTRGENVLLGVGASAINQAKQLCPNGHKYDGIKKNGNRFCRICRSITQRASWERRKQEANNRRRLRYAIAKAEGRDEGTAEGKGE